MPHNYQLLRNPVIFLHSNHTQKCLLWVIPRKEWQWFTSKTVMEIMIIIKRKLLLRSKTCWQLKLQMLHWTSEGIKTIILTHFMTKLTQRIHLISSAMTWFKLLQKMMVIITPDSMKMIRNVKMKYRISEDTMRNLIMYSKNQDD